MRGLATRSAGPGAAVFVFVGCIGSNPPLLACCGHNPFGRAIVVALAAWFVFGTID